MYVCVGYGNHELKTANGLKATLKEISTIHFASNVDVAQLHVLGVLSAIVNQMGSVKFLPL